MSVVKRPRQDSTKLAIPAFARVSRFAPLAENFGREDDVRVREADDDA
jgi:hypothetical protein